MNHPDKLTALLEPAGLVVRRAWSERFEQAWDVERLIALQVGHTYRQHLERLTTDVRAACLARVCGRLATIGPDQLVFRPEILFAVAERPCGASERCGWGT